MATDLRSPLAKIEFLGKVESSIVKLAEAALAFSAY